jgi:hypothetical protein
MNTDDLRTSKDGRTIFWNGHACEGCRLVPGQEGTFVLWTRCGGFDVPANDAYLKIDADVITCQACVDLLATEAKPCA